MIVLFTLAALAGPWGTTKRTCSKGEDVSACVEAASALAETGDDRAAPLIAEACTAGALGACELLTRWSLLDQAPVPLAPGTARSAMAQLCQATRMDSCTDLGWMLEHGHDGEPDLDGAREVYSRACRAGSAPACQALSSLSGDPRVATCAAGSSEACVALAAEWIGGARTTELETPLQAACALGTAEACGILGTLLVRGHGIEGDGPTGLSLLERACTLGAAASCIGAADLWLTGMVGPRDPDRAHELLHRGCEQGDPAACARDHDH